MACIWTGAADLSRFHKVKTREMNESYVSLVNAWLQTDEAVGMFHSMPHPHPGETTTIWFSDPQTAFAFKMRFG